MPCVSSVFLLFTQNRFFITHSFAVLSHERPRVAYPYAFSRYGHTWGRRRASARRGGAPLVYDITLPGGSCTVLCYSVYFRTYKVRVLFYSMKSRHPVPLRAIMAVSATPHHVMVARHQYSSESTYTARIGRKITVWFNDMKAFHFRIGFEPVFGNRLKPG